MVIYMLVLYSLSSIYPLLLVLLFFFFKQKTAYEMRISDWSSDVCSSDLRSPCSSHVRGTPRVNCQYNFRLVSIRRPDTCTRMPSITAIFRPTADRKSVV